MSKYPNTHTAANHHELEGMYGVRYTELLRLPYFDIVQQHFVDPMHNLLGSGKYLMSLWKEKGIFDREQLENIQDQVNDIQVPATIGWISHKTMSSFTADQWKNWICIYSSVYLHNLVCTIAGQIF